MKLAVHCEPLVKSCTPGWMVAVAAGAQLWAVAVGAVVAVARKAPAGAARATPSRTRVMSRIMLRKRASRPNLAEFLRLGEDHQQFELAVVLGGDGPVGRVGDAPVGEGHRDGAVDGDGGPGALGLEVD